MSRNRSSQRVGECTYLVDQKKRSRAMHILMIMIEMREKEREKVGSQQMTKTEEVVME